MNQIPNIEDWEKTVDSWRMYPAYDMIDYDRIRIDEIKHFIHHQLQKAREEEREKWIGNDAYSFLGNELHLYCRACIDKVKITRNGQVFEFTLPKDHSELDHLPDRPPNQERE